MRVKAIIAAAVVAVAMTLTGCGASRPVATDMVATDIASEGKPLIVYFSHAGDNYLVGNVDTGNTAIVARQIAEMTGGDTFEIKTSRYDGKTKRELRGISKEESEKGELPEYEGDVDVSGYKVIFIGGPIWHGTYPRVVFTFMGRHDLNGKTIVPFATSEGSGLGRTVEDVKSAYPRAKVVGAFSIKGHKVRGDKASVEAWIRGMGY